MENELNVKWIHKIWMINYWFCYCIFQHKEHFRTDRKKIFFVPSMSTITQTSCLWQRNLTVNEAKLVALTGRTFYIDSYIEIAWIFLKSFFICCFHINFIFTYFLYLLISHVNQCENLKWTMKAMPTKNNYILKLFRMWFKNDCQLFVLPDFQAQHLC